MFEACVSPGRSPLGATPSVKPRAIGLAGAGNVVAQSVAMVIRRSTAGELQRLVGDLSSESDVRREVAVARLALLGARAVPKLLTLLSADESAVRAAALRALEATGEVRALQPALSLLGDPDRVVALAAVGVARAHLRSAEGAVALDSLAGVALDSGREDALRIAALDALGELSRRTVEPVLSQLRRDPSAAVRRRAAALAGDASGADAAARLEVAAQGTLPEDPAALRTLVSDAPSAPVPTLHRLLSAIRAREAEEPDRARRDQWMAARASVHRALAERDSRVALYDLRETLEAASGPLPVDLLAALSLVGDASCLESIAAAYAAAPRSHRARRPDWWTQHLVDAFRAILRRERLTRRHSSLKRIATRWPAAARDLLGSRR